MKWTSGDNDTKMIVLGNLYRYNEEGLLVAKEYFQSYEAPEKGEGNMLEYDYDGEGRLIEEREYAPSYDFVLLLRKTYKYYD